MGFLAGANMAVDLRILGFARGVPLSLANKAFPVMWFGLIVNAVSGILLLLGYPTKALTNPVFYVKLGCIAAGIVLSLWLRAKVIRNPAMDSGWISTGGKLMAVCSLALWIGAITAGRFLAYTCNYLRVGIPC
jgi:hypothetical protein